MLLTAPSSDVCIALTVVETLRQAVEDCYFVSEDFVPFLAPVLSQLPGVMSSCEQLESLVRSIAGKAKFHVHRFLIL
jgi:hypothetical protein